MNKNIMLVDICEDDFIKYLELLRTNSNYREIYDSLEGLWESVAEGIRKNFEGGETKGCLIYNSVNFVKSYVRMNAYYNSG